MWRVREMWETLKVYVIVTVGRVVVLERVEFGR